MIKIRSIRDLTTASIEATMPILNSFNLGAELMRWSAIASERSIPWDTQYSWNGHRTTHVFHPSALGRGCDYQLYLDLMGAKAVPKIHYSTQCVFDTGTAIEAQLQYYVHTYSMQHGWVYNSHPKIDPAIQPVASKYSIGGTGDGEGVIAIDGELVASCLYEFKTIRENAYHRVVDPRKSHKGYILQMHAYMACLDLPLGWLVFINKNVSLIKAFPIFFDNEIWKGVTDRLSKIQMLVEERKKPEKSSVAYTCRECKYLEVCDPPISQKRPTSRSAVMRDL